jgi:hypothetical protein
MQAVRPRQPLSQIQMPRPMSQHASQSQAQKLQASQLSRQLRQEIREERHDIQGIFLIKLMLLFCYFICVYDKFSIYFHWTSNVNYLLSLKCLFAFERLFPYFHVNYFENIFIFILEQHFDECEKIYVGWMLLLI